jgi:hypothetical protein
MAHLPSQSHSQPLDIAVIERELKEARDRLLVAWGEEPWLVTASASKRLRYSVAEKTPVALWALLTWLAPANLFVFINRAVCQPAHFQGIQRLRPDQPPGPQGPGVSGFSPRIDRSPNGQVA